MSSSRPDPTAKGTKGRKALTTVLAAALLTAAPVSATATASPGTARDASPGSGAAPTSADPSPLPLHRLFDNTGTAPDGPVAPGQGGLDGAGNALSRDDLAAAGWAPGSRLTLDGTPLTWPDSRPGQPDNVVADGQAVRPDGRGDGRGEALSFLVTATGGTAGGTGAVRYRDGSRSTFALTSPDWRSGPLGSKIIALPHVNGPDGRREEAARLYTVTVPLDPGRPVDSVVLPQDRDGAGKGADLHVFALSVREPAKGWTGTWAASTGGYTAVGPWRDQTLRLAVRATGGGPRARIRLGNAFAARAVEIGGATVALRGDGAAAEGKPVPLTFGGGERGVRVPAGGQAVSDPAPFAVPAGAQLLVSIHLPGPVEAAPVHAHALRTSWISPPGSGDRTADTGAKAFTGTLKTWPFLTGVDVSSPSPRSARGSGTGAVVTLGDSITDGVGSTADADNRWPDVLSRRLLGADRPPVQSVLNHGISANRIVTDRYPGDGVSRITGGVSAQNRLERDVLSQPGVRTVVVFEGINDLRAGTSPEEVAAGLRAVAERARARGLRVVVATVAPCGGYPDCSAQVEARRQTLNAFIRSDRGLFDGVADFDAVLRDPAAPHRLLPAYDSGDHLHPGDAGLTALGESFDLRLL